MPKDLQERIKNFLAETGYDESEREYWKLLAEAHVEIAGLRRFKASVDEALNSGNGSYKP